jgi:hypothetical protein
VLTSDRACGVVAKQPASVKRPSEGGTGYRGVSDVLGSSGVRTMSPKNWVYKTDLIVKCDSCNSGEVFRVHYCFYLYQ